MKDLVSVHWLEANLNIENIVVLDASPAVSVSDKASNYEFTLIPGSRHFDIKNRFSNQDSDFPNTIPTAKEFEEECRSLGIDCNSHIVVYDSKGIYTSPRAWWLFKTMGHSSVSILDGGLPEWLSNNFDTIKNYSSDSGNGDFVSMYNPEVVKFYKDVKANVLDGEYQILDARAQGRFEGVAPEPRKHLMSGKIPNSLNLPYQEVLQNGQYKSVEDLKSIFDKLIIKDKKIIFSCGSGITACIILFAKYLVDNNMNYLYDGSWAEWATKEGMLTYNKNRT